MKVVEYQHRNEGGGNTVVLDNETWEHGEAVLIVSKRELLGLLHDVRGAIKNTRHQDGVKKLVHDVITQITRLP